MTDNFNLNAASIGFTVSFKYLGGSNYGGPRLVTILEIYDDHWIAYDHEDRKIKNYTKSKIQNYGLICPDNREVYTSIMIDEEIEDLSIGEKVDCLIYNERISKKSKIFNDINFGKMVCNNIPIGFDAFCKKIGYKRKPSKNDIEAEVEKLRKKYDEMFQNDMAELKKKMSL